MTNEEREEWRAEAKKALKATKKLYVRWHELLSKIEEPITHHYGEHAAVTLCNAGNLIAVTINLDIKDELNEMTEEEVREDFEKNKRGASNE